MKLRPNAILVPSTEKKFGETPAITICSGFPSSATRGPGPALMAAMLWNAVACSFKSGMLPGAIGKFRTFRAFMSVWMVARRSGSA